MEPTSVEAKVSDEEDADVLIVPISFGNPSNEIIRGELRLSQKSEVRACNFNFDGTLLDTESTVSTARKPWL